MSATVLSAEKQARLGKPNSDKMLRGRKEPKIYIEFLLTFGDIYLEHRLKKGKMLYETISEGNKLSELITTNMEALMRTVVYVGCSSDWPKYLESEEYLSWCNKRYVWTRGHGPNMKTTEGKDSSLSLIHI